MALTIRNEEARRLAEELAALTGETLSAAVTEAVRERLEKVKREQDREGMAERLMEISRRAAPHFKEPWRSMNFDDLLYDEHGLPK